MPFRARKVVFVIIFVRLFYNAFNGDTTFRFRKFGIIKLFAAAQSAGRLFVVEFVYHIYILTLKRLSVNSGKP